MRKKENIPMRKRRIFQQEKGKIFQLGKIKLRNGRRRTTRTRRQKQMYKTARASSRSKTGSLRILSAIQTSARF